MTPSRTKIDVDLNNVDKHFHKILSFDPTPIFERISHKIKPFNRFQSIGMSELFPSNEEGKCACGCGVLLSGRRKRWASDECSKLASHVFTVTRGDSAFITRCLQEAYGMGCSVCGKTSMEINRPNVNDWRSPIELEHTIPIKLGGGGPWLSGYTLQCFICHREKTNKDFGFKQVTTEQVAINQLNLL